MGGKTAASAVNAGRIGDTMRIVNGSPRGSELTITSSTRDSQEV
jgi:hypothetical protein